MEDIKHRGPDDAGVFTDGPVGLGFVRLSILDLSAAGHQPMFSQDGRYVVVFNGEIYNYVELREELNALGHSFRSNTDTEVLLYSYIEWGEDCLDKFNGMWAMAIYDLQEKRIFASRDRYGIKPFYYYADDRFFAFASEISPLLSLLPGPPQADQLSIFDYLVFNRTDQTERTFYDGIKKLQHGHQLSFRLPVAELPERAIKKWYDLRERLKEAKGFDSPEELRALFSDSVRLRLRSDVPVGVCLSGGLDSSSIVSSILKDHHKEDLQTFSVVFGPGVETDERKYIQLYSDLVCRQHYKTLDAQVFLEEISDFTRAVGEPVPSGGPFAQFNVMKIAKGHAVVLLDGQGADEIFGGYKYFWGYYFNDLIKKFKLVELARELKAGNDKTNALLTALFYALPPQLQTKLRYYKLSRFISRAFIEENISSSTLSGSLYQAPNFNRALVNHMEYKLEHLLKWEDRNSMWFGLEARVPFLDYRIVEKSLKTNSSLQMHRGFSKNLLREAMAKDIPHKILERREKIGFGAPKKDWFQDPGVNRFLISVVRQNSGFLSRYFNLPEVEKAITAHRKGQKDFSPVIWKAFNLGLWHHQTNRNVQSNIFAGLRNSRQW